MWTLVCSWTYYPCHSGALVDRVRPALPEQAFLEPLGWWVEESEELVSYVRFPCI
jgi:hypothetical protein